MRNLLLVLHILAAAIWLGANAVQAFAGPRSESASREARAWWADTTGAMAKVLYNVAGVVILLSGVGLVVESEVWTFSERFVSVGFAAVIIGAVLGMVVFGPGSRRLSEAIHRGDVQTEQATASRLRLFGLLDTIVVVVAVVAMVAKW